MNRRSFMQMLGGALAALGLGRKVAAEGPEHEMLSPAHGALIVGDTPEWADLPKGGRGYARELTIEGAAGEPVICRATVPCFDACVWCTNRWHCVTRRCDLVCNPDCDLVGLTQHWDEIVWQD